MLDVQLKQSKFVTSADNVNKLCNFVLKICVWKQTFAGQTRKDQNTGGALLEFPMRTAMHGKSRVSSAISVCDDWQNFKIGFSSVAVVQWIRRWISGHRVVQAEDWSPGGDIYQFFSNDFYFSFVRPNGLQ